MRRPTWSGQVDVIIADLIALALLGAGQALLLARNFGVRLSQPPIDESPVAHAYFFAQPESFNLDAYMNVWSHVAMGSIMNWAPAFLFKYLSVPPEFFFALFVILQTAGLGCASYYLAISAFKSRSIGWLTALFVLMWRPHFFNLALIGGLDWMPYANWLALPCLVMAAAMSIERRTTASASWLIVGALIHPIMALMTAAMVALHIVTMQNLSGRAIFTAAALSISVCVVGFLPGYIATSGLASAPAEAELLLSNPHVYPPGAEYPFGIAALVNGLCWTVGLFVIALSGMASASRESRSFLVCAGTTTFVLCALHVLAVLFQVGPVLNVIFSRSSILLLLLATPFAMSRVANDLASTSIARVVASLVLVFHCSSLSLLGVIALSPIQRDARFNIIKWAGVVIALATSFVLLLSHVPEFQVTVHNNLLAWMDGWKPWLLTWNRLSLFDWKLFLGCTAVIVAVNILGRMLPMREATRFCLLLAPLIAAMTISASSDNLEKGVEETTGVFRDLYDAQIWARDHTQSGSAFINTGLAPLAWRGVSHRQTVVTYKVGVVYVSTPEAKNYNVRMADFRQRNSITDPDNWLALDEHQWRAFKSEFGGDFLVRRADWRALSFPIVYSNTSFVIYSLND